MAFDIGILTKCAVFKRLNKKELNILEPYIGLKKYLKDEVVFEEGAKAQALFVVYSGKVDIMKKGAGGEPQNVAGFSMGEIFGEVAFFDKYARTAAAVACDQLQLVEITYNGLAKLIMEEPALGVKLLHGISQILCERLRKTTAELSTFKELNEYFIV